RARTGVKISKLSDDDQLQATRSALNWIWLDEQARSLLAEGSKKISSESLVIGGVEAKAVESIAKMYGVAADLAYETSHNISPVMEREMAAIKSSSQHSVTTE